MLLFVCVNKIKFFGIFTGTLLAVLQNAQKNVLRKGLCERKH